MRCGSSCARYFSCVLLGIRNRTGHGPRNRVPTPTASLCGMWASRAHKPCSSEIVSDTGGLSQNHSQTAHLDGSLSVVSVSLSLDRCDGQFAARATGHGMTDDTAAPRLKMF